METRDRLQGDRADAQTHILRWTVHSLPYTAVSQDESRIRFTEKPMQVESYLIRRSFQMLCKIRGLVWLRSVAQCCGVSRVRNRRSRIVLAGTTRRTCSQVVCKERFGASGLG